jgi:hypothetical protein
MGLRFFRVFVQARVPAYPREILHGLKAVKDDASKKLRLTPTKKE